MDNSNIHSDPDELGSPVPTQEEMDTLMGRTSYHGEIDLLPDDVVNAPFTEEQVRSLNQYQFSGVFHPFTCANPECTAHRHIGHWIGEDGEPMSDKASEITESIYLVATPDSWICGGCGYKQHWAWRWMADFEWVHHGGPGR